MEDVDDSNFGEQNPIDPRYLKSFNDHEGFGLRLWLQLCFPDQNINTLTIDDLHNVQEFSDIIESSGFQFDDGGFFDSQFYRKASRTDSVKSKYYLFAHFCLIGVYQKLAPGPWVDLSYINKLEVNSGSPETSNLYELLEKSTQSDSAFSYLIDIEFIRWCLKLRPDLFPSEFSNDKLTSYDLLKVIGQSNTYIFFATSPFYWPAWIANHADFTNVPTIKFLNFCANQEMEKILTNPNPWLDVSSHYSDTDRPKTVNDAVTRYIEDLQPKQVRPTAKFCLLFEAFYQGVPLTNATIQNLYNILMRICVRKELSEKTRIEFGSLDPDQILKIIDKSYYGRKYARSLENTAMNLSITSMEDHYIAVGSSLGYSAAPWFSEISYQKLHPDVSKSLMKKNILSGFSHYIQYGKSENRKISINKAPRFRAGSVYIISIIAMGGPKCTVEIQKARAQDILNPGDWTSKSIQSFTFPKIEAMFRFVVRSLGSAGPSVAIIGRAGSKSNPRPCPDIDVASVLHPDRFQLDGDVHHTTAVDPSGILSLKRLIQLFEGANVIAFRADAVTEM